MKAVIAVMPVMPRATPNSALTIGSPAATSEPNVRMRTTRASAMPISSEAPPGGAIEDMPDPFASAVRPAVRAPASASLTASWVAGSTSVVVSTSRSKVRVPTRPSSDNGSSARASASAWARGVPESTAWSTIVRSCSGAVTAGLVSWASAGICGPSARSVIRASTASEYAGSASVCPSGAATTTVTVGPVEGVDGLGEELGLEVGRLLGRDARDGEGVGHRLRHRGGDAADGEHGDQPAREEEGPPPEGGLAEAVEEVGHGDGLSGRAGRVGWVRTGGRGWCAGRRRRPRAGCGDRWGPRAPRRGPGRAG